VIRLLIERKQAVGCPPIALALPFPVAMTKEALFCL
jgi:hypothetical protein